MEMAVHVIPEVLFGKRVLIVEDEFLVALMLEDVLVDFGCIPVGPCYSLAQALGAVRTETFDVALLDVNLDGEKVYPVAYALAKRRIPFLFVSSYGDAAILPGHSEWKVCAKPFKACDLAEMLAGALRGANFSTQASLASL
jgi:CheY-like chemotaxis protein